MKVKVLVENSNCEGFGSEHGLSILVLHHGKEYLIDTGASGLYSENAKKMGVDLAGTDVAFLSHAHYDHSGGYKEFFKINKKATVYLQEAARYKYFYKIVGPVKKYIGIPKGILEEYRERFSLVDGYLSLEDGVYVLPHTTKGLEERGKHAHMYSVKENQTLVDDFSHEQTVVFEDGEELVLFNSCSHGGVENIIEEVKERFPDKKIKAFFGGFHMMGALGTNTCSFTKEQVQKVAARIKDSSEAVFYSGHCTGTVAYEWLEEVMGERLQALHAGLEVEI